MCFYFFYTTIYKYSFFLIMKTTAFSEHFENEEISPLGIEALIAIDMVLYKLDPPANDWCAEESGMEYGRE